MVPVCSFGPIPESRVEVRIDEPHIRWMRGTAPSTCRFRARIICQTRGSRPKLAHVLAAPLRQQWRIVGLLIARR